MHRAELRAASAAGFTLIEVLAAVAILGIFVSILAELAFQGLRAEGDSVRRVEASLLADTRIQEIEAQAVAGNGALGRRETRQDLFTITQELRGFDPAKDGLAAWLAALAPKASARPARGFELLQAGRSAPLRIAHVEVRWKEGSDARRVTRSTLVVDEAALEPQLDPLADDRTQKAGGPNADGGPANSEAASGSSGPERGSPSP